MRVGRRLRDEIADGTLPAGQRLAPERELCLRLGVSRNTLRRSLLALAGDGLLVAAGRHGWYVAGAPVVESAHGPVSLTVWARDAGLALSSRVLRAGIRPATGAEAAALGLAAGGAVFELERVRSVGGVALSLDRACLPAAYAPALDGVDFSTASLYDALRTRAGVEPGRRECVLRAATADARTARLLEIPSGAPLLIVTETVLDRGGSPLEFSRLANRGDRWGYRTTHISPEMG